MKNSELNKLVYWAIKILKQQFEKDPYSLSSEELMAIKSVSYTHLRAHET